MLVPDRIFPDGIHIPKPLLGRSMLHLPTTKPHVFTTTGAMMNALGGLLHDRRHLSHGIIHEALDDLR